MILEGGRGGGSVLKNQFQGGGGGGSVLKNQFEGGGGGGSELSDQLLDPDVPTLASQDKLKVSPKGLPFVIYTVYIYIIDTYIQYTNLRFVGL